ncbi:hypothetical protein ACQY0O_004299 [Thecaphora frezii]
MVVTRSKRGSKEQAQLAAVSEALTKGLATSKRKSFADDDDDNKNDKDDDNEDAAVAGLSLSKSQDQDGDLDSDDDDDAPVEEVSNKSTKRKLATEASKKKADQKAAEAKRRQAEQERLQKRQQEAKQTAQAALEKQQAKRGKKKAPAKSAAVDDDETAEASPGAQDEEDEDVSGDGDDEPESDAFHVEEDDLDADLDEAEEDSEGADDGVQAQETSVTNDAVPTAGPSRLDPSLFAQAFATKKPTAKSILKRRAVDPITAEMEEEERQRRKKLRAKRKGGIVKGRDGMPMRRLPDGTIVRSLSSHSAFQLGKKKTNFDDDTEGADDEDRTPLDPAVRPMILDPTTALPNAKIRGFKKRKLGLAQPAPAVAATAPSSNTQAKKKKAAATIRDDDDPLGLNDPAFLPGGEFYKPQKLTGARPRKDPQNTGAGTPGALARQGFRGRGGRTDALKAMSSGQRTGPALGFARSLA